MLVNSFINEIIQGDSIKVLKKIPNDFVDLIFADPPYNLQLKNELYRPNQTRVAGVEDDWDKFTSFEEYDKFTKAYLKECRRVLKPTGTLWIIGSYHNIYRVGSILQDLNFWILNDIVWIKSNPMPNFKGTRFNNAHETLLWVSKSEKAKITFNYKTMKAFNGDLQMRSDWTMPICSGGERLKKADGVKAHSTQKPEELLKRIILATSKEGDIVLDPFFGSGTTGAVAKLLNRKFIGIEKQKKYVDLAKKRIDNIQPYDTELTFPYQETQPPKVLFSSLVANNHIEVGQTLYSKDKKYQAVVMADGTLKNGKYSGSIHKVSAKMLAKTNHNGWKFWYVEKNGQLSSIDKLRHKYAQNLAE